MFFKIDAYFLQHNLALEIDEKILTGRDLIFEQKRPEALEKILDFDFIRINTIKEGYDTIYETGRIQAFLSKFKIKKVFQIDCQKNFQKRLVKFITKNLTDLLKRTLKTKIHTV